MNNICALSTLFVVLAFDCFGQNTIGNLSERLRQARAESQVFYEKQEFAHASAILADALKAEPAIALLPEWPDTLYNLACDQARANKLSEAQVTLQKAIDLGAGVSADHLLHDPDLSMLRNQADFRRIVERLKGEEAIWKESSAIATPYEPILTAEEKVAGLSKFWAEARFNFPFFSRLPGLDWDLLYIAYLKKVQDAKTTAEYYRVLMRFAAELKDSHTNVYPPPQLLDHLEASPGPRTQLISGAVVITEVLDPNLRASGWQKGDVILKVGNADVRVYAETTVAPYISSSSSQDRDVRTFNYLLLSGDINEPLSLTVEDAHGKREIRTIKRLPTRVVGPMFRTIPVEFRVLRGNIAFMAVNEFEDDAGVKAILEHFVQIQSANGLILDLRRNGGGNSQNGVDILRMLAASPFYWESEKTPDYKAVNRAWGLAQQQTTLPQPLIQPDFQHHLSLPVAVLTSAETFSAAEDFVALFNSMRRGRTIGQATAGSTGQPFSFKLPGGGSARVCTKDTRTPEGRIYMGLGLKPDMIVEQSIDDMRAGRDAAMEQAVNALRAAVSRVPSTR